MSTTWFCLSRYKNCNTLKALISISPTGAITYVSHLYTGSISDKAIFLESDLPRLLRQGDLVLADKGFRIENELKGMGVKLVTPIFLRDKVQFNISQVAFNKSVSHYRVHVERAISRIKIYKYFEGPIQYSTLDSANDLFFIAAHLTNFKGHMIKVEINPESK